MSPVLCILLMRACVRRPNWHQDYQADAHAALLGAFMLACNGIQNGFMKITGV